MDCRHVLQCVAQVESSVSVSTPSFGHPEPCQMIVRSLQQNVVLVVAYTERTVAAHVTSRDEAIRNEPLLVCQLVPEDLEEHEEDERISSLEVIVLDENEDEANEEEEDTSEPSSMPGTPAAKPMQLDTATPTTPHSITNSTSLMTGTVITGPGLPGKDAQRLAVILGTTASRLYTVELRLAGTHLQHAAILEDDDCEEEESHLFQVFPTETSRKRRRSHGGGGLSWCPTGGVTHLQAPPRGIVTITYGDGNLVRVPPSALFPSVWRAAVARNLSVEDFVREEEEGARLWRGHVLLPPAPPGKGHVLLRVAPPPAVAPLALRPQKNAVVQVLALSAADIAGNANHPGIPTLCFYSAERHVALAKDGDDKEDENDADEEEAENVAPDTASVRSMASSFMGALRWGLRTTTSPRPIMQQPQPPVVERPTTPTVDEMEVDSTMTPDNNRPAASAPFPSLSSEPTLLYAYQELHDPPRAVESCALDPNGRYAAACDCLGRVLLIDMTTHQVVRLWKGYRDGTCGWLQTPPSANAGSWHSNSSRPALYLVLHSRQRRTVEVWRVRRGARVSVRPVGTDTRLVTGWQWNEEMQRHLAQCYILPSAVPGTVGRNVLEPLPVVVVVAESNTLTLTTAATTPESVSVTPSSAVSTVRGTTSSRRAAQRLQHLQQLLSSDTMQYAMEDVRQALQEIRSLADLAAALDLLAGGRVLETALGVEGAEFHKEALSYSRGVLHAALQRNKGQGHVQQNPHVQLLTHKIDYHTQIVRAFDCLYKFENTKNEAFQQKSVLLSPWASEAMLWATTYEKVTKEKLVSAVDPSETKLLFAEFASACVFPDFSEPEKKPLKVYFSESSRIRRDVVATVFRPLLADVFSFNVVYAVFDSLGTRVDCRYLEKCFGEWFMTLSIEDVYRRGLNAESPPMVRLLQDLVARQLSVSQVTDDMLPLEELHAFCSKSQDLIRSFLLATMCLNAVTRAADQKEKRSYGKVTSTDMVEGWITLLRKLRVCLLVSLRMHGKRLVAPVTIDNVEQPDVFSVYEWLAQDELTLGQSHEEIVALEQTCAMSNHAFDPSTEEGDSPSRSKVLQSSCLAASISEDERAEYLVDVDRFEVLLLFLSKFNRPMLLAAHRALIEAVDWGATPINLALIKNALQTLKSLRTMHRTLTASVALEIWQSQLCPIYRAHLFGFHDVQELSEEVIAPLLQDQQWLRSIGQVGLELLELLQECIRPGLNEKDIFASEPSTLADEKSWPPVRPDCVLQKLVGKVANATNKNSLDAHSVVVCALLVSGDIKTVANCVPSIYELFYPQSLFGPVSTSPQTVELQQSYLNEALVSFARRYTGPCFDKFELQEIKTLVKVWGLDTKSVNAQFLLVMYEVGKDDAVDELITKSPSQINVPTFVDGGLNIACRRLHAFLTSRNARSVLGLLDAEMCSWISQRTKKSTSLVDAPELHMPVGNTHLFIMRLLTLSAGSNIEAPIRVKIHSLSVLSGILIKALAQTTSIS